ncbi:hypothetical protein [Paenibacillus sp. BK720]|nr:hypothetical protein [Paenibacillus sp. BK720]NIK67115.1 hypothetical protein [Paenibacillus sp. BK720]
MLEHLDQLGLQDLQEHSGQQDPQDLQGLQEHLEQQDLQVQRD